MFSNVLRNIDTHLLEQQQEELTDLIRREKIPLNHPLVGLLGLVAGLLMERTVGENRVDLSMNYWKGKDGGLCVNFHPSLYSLNVSEKMALSSGLCLSTLPPRMEIEDFMGMVTDIMEETTLIRSVTQNDQLTEET